MDGILKKGFNYGQKWFNYGFNHGQQNITFKTKRGITSSEKTIADIFNNYFVNIAE